MFEHWEHQNSRRVDVLDEFDPGPQQLLTRVVGAIETVALAAAFSFLSASASMWLVETFVR